MCCKTKLAVFLWMTNKLTEKHVRELCHFGVDTDNSVQSFFVETWHTTDVINKDIDYKDFDKCHQDKTGKIKNFARRYWQWVVIIHDSAFNSKTEDMRSYGHMMNNVQMTRSQCIAIMRICVRCLYLFLGHIRGLFHKLCDISTFLNCRISGSVVTELITGPHCLVITQIRENWMGFTCQMNTRNSCLFRMKQRCLIYGKCA